MRREDVMIIVTTHQEYMLPTLLRSLSQVPHQKVINIAQNKLGTNFKYVFDVAKNSGKRYVVTMDDDIELIDSDTIDRCIEVMEDKNWAMCSTYETYNKEFDPSKHALEPIERKWLPGYLIVIDMQKMSGYIVDSSLNDNEDHIDIDMSMYAHSLGYRMGRADRVVIHNTDNHTPESKLKMIRDGHSQYFIAHDNLLRKWSMESTIVPGKSVYDATYVKAENVYSALT